MAGREFAEIWGEQMHAARHLRIVSTVLVLVLVVMAVALMRLAWAPQPRPLVVRVDEVGRAEAVAYEAMQGRPTRWTRPPGISCTGSWSTTTRAAGPRWRSTSAGRCGS